jgi:RNA polymerase sigma-70 factor (ECF subfamily)
VQRPAAEREPTDAQLLAAIRRENLNALGSLFRRHRRRVERVLARLGISPTDADDVVQMTFLEVARVAGAYDGHGSCAPWVCAIAIRLAARRRRSLGRLLQMLSVVASESPSIDPLEPERALASREELEVFATALARLGRKKREAFVMVEIEGFSSEEAARALATKPETVRTPSSTRGGSSASQWTGGSDDALRSRG